MKYSRVNLVCFSATDTTKVIVEKVAAGLRVEEIVTYNITRGQKDEISFSANEIVVFGMPVYSGRIPQISIEHLNKFRGSGSPAIIVCVYGNRDYDDALLELRDVVMANNFQVVSAGAFVAQHSIFPSTAAGRPDSVDLDEAIKFGEASMKVMDRVSPETGLFEIEVKGNFPYRETKAIPLKPKANRKCDACGKCARNCPVDAIDITAPRSTNKGLCISCARCIHICPQKARSFRGLIYKVVSGKFNKANKDRKNNEQYFIN